MSETPAPGTAGQPAGARASYVAFPSLHSEPLMVAGRLNLPPRVEPPLPAVVIVHGSAGVDGRGAALASVLNGGGIATLEIDMWAPRRLAGNLSRPAHTAETLPDAFGALRYLASREDVDGARVGIAGFSWGGGVSMLSATRRYVHAIVGEDGPRFAAHAPYYPVCWAYNRRQGYEFGGLTGAPVLLQAGALDGYDRPTACAELVASLKESDRRHVRVIVHAGATHAFDRLQPEITVTDPHAHEGAGGEVVFAPNPEATARAHRETLAFFRSALAVVR